MAVVVMTPTEKALMVSVRNKFFIIKEPFLAKLGPFVSDIFGHFNAPIRRLQGKLAVFVLTR
jgi:hypothetical protein